MFILVSSKGHSYALSTSSLLKDTFEIWILKSNFVRQLCTGPLPLESRLNCPTSLCSLWCWVQWSLLSCPYNDNIHTLPYHKMFHRPLYLRSLNIFFPYIFIQGLLDERTCESSVYWASKTKLAFWSVCVLGQCSSVCESREVGRERLGRRWFLPCQCMSNLQLLL